MGKIFATAMNEQMHWQYHNTIKNRLRAIYVKRLYHFFFSWGSFFAVYVIFCSEKRRDDNCQPLQKITFEFPVGKYTRLSLGLFMARVSYVAVFKISNRYACCSLLFFVVDSLFQFFIDHLFQLDSVRAFSIIVSFYRCTIRTNRSPFVQQILWMK